MSTKLWKFNALDTLFFRDGTPYNAGERGQGQVAANFPPYITTLQGAVRTALATGQGWSPEEKHKWPEELGTPDDLGLLTLRGPYLFQGEELLFPAPFLYLKQGKDATFRRLIPGVEVECDLGMVRLPEMFPALEGAKPPEKQWLTKSGLVKVLSGDVPEAGDVVVASKLWKNENRTGIKLKPDTRTAEDSNLYSCVHVRPNQDVSLAVEVDGVPMEWYGEVPTAVRLGGEGRLARIEVSEAKLLQMPAAPVLESACGKIYYTIILITPGFYEDPHSTIKNGPPGMLGKCVSACTGKAEQVGGWDIVNRCPRPLYPLVPAGSAWFFEADAREKDEVLSLHGKCVGNRLEYGFGQILIGSWRDAK